MGGYAGLSRSWTLDRRSQGGRRPSFGHQIRGSDSRDPTLMLLNAFFFLVCGLGSKHSRGAAAVDGGGRIRPSRRRARGSATSNRRRPRRSSGPREWRLIGRSISGRRRIRRRGRCSWARHRHRRPGSQGRRGQARRRCERRGWRTFDAGKIRFERLTLLSFLGVLGALEKNFSKEGHLLGMFMLTKLGSTMEVINITITDAWEKRRGLPAQLGLEFIVRRLHIVQSFLHGEFHRSGLFAGLVM